MNAAAAAPDPSSDGALDAPAGIEDLLAAYQFLQSKNNRLAADLSTRLDIGSTDLRVILHLFSAENLTPKDLAVRLDVSTGAITALVDRLEKGGYAERRPHPTDRRSQTLHLTDTGRSVVATVRDSYREAFQGLFSTAELPTAVRVLRTLAEGLVVQLDEVDVMPLGLAG